MDIDLRRTATDTAYIVVGVGVLGYQQAQVRRREAVTRFGTLRQDARSTLGQWPEALRSRADELTAAIGTKVGTVGTHVRGAAGTVTSADPRQWVEPVVDDLRGRVEPVLEQLRTVSVPDAVATLPEQLSKAIELGASRVAGRRGASPTAPPATGTAGRTT